MINDDLKLAGEINQARNQLARDLAYIKEVLSQSLDRDRDPSDTPCQLANLASNAIYWRRREIEAFKQWLMNETGTTDLIQASTELRRWRQLSGLFQPHRDRPSFDPT